MVTVEHLARVCPRTPRVRLEACVEPFNESTASADIGTPERVAMYLAQTAHESADFTRFDENLNYSTTGLMRVWKNRFPTVQTASPYAGNPERLANLVYADRLGNGDVASGDGWKFRGRGPIQATGHAAYLRFYRETGIDVVSNPDLLLRLDVGFRFAAKFWTWNGLNVYADRRDVAGCTKRIQGALEGVEDRQRRFDVALALFTLGLAPEGA